MNSDYSTLLNLYKDHSGLVNTLWGVLQVVALGLLGFVYKEEYIRRNPKILLPLTLAFVGFAMGNQKAILRSQAVLRAVYDQFQDPTFLSALSPSVRSVLLAHQASTVEEIRRGHWLLIGVVVVATWLPYLFDRAKKSGSTAA